MVEMVTVLFLMGLFAGMGLWMLMSSRSGQTAKTGAAQIASDLRACMTRAETEKRPYGIRFRTASAASNPSTYTFMRFNDDLTWTALNKAIPGASYNKQIISMPGRGKITSITPAGYLFDSGRQMDVRFQPIGEIVYSQFGDGGTSFTGFWMDATITVTDDSGSKTKTVTIYPRGDVGI